MINKNTLNYGFIALIIAGIFVPDAHAQSNVTLYGIVDGGLLYTNRTQNSATGQNDGHQLSFAEGDHSASRFGLKGSEDLGGGLTAMFGLESGIAISNGSLNNSNGNFFGRQAWIALDGGFGRVKAGLQYSPFFLAIDTIDPRGFSQFGSSLVSFIDNVLGSGAFVSNSVSYTSPTLAGFTASGMIALGGVTGNFQAGRQYAASLKYESGGLKVVVAFFDGNSGGTVQTPIPTTEQFEGRTIGVAYNFGSMTASAAFTNFKTAGSFDNNVYDAGLNYRYSPQLDLNSGVWITSDRNDTKNNSIVVALGADYSLSKQTILYAQLGMVRNHGMMDSGLAINGALFGVSGTTLGANLGISHSF